MLKFVCLFFFSFLRELVFNLWRERVIIDYISSLVKGDQYGQTTLKGIYLCFDFLKKITKDFTQNEPKLQR